MSNEIKSRRFAFQGSNSYKDNPNSVFTLGVYNLFTESGTNCLLATDPYCLYAQFALCKKNSLAMPSGQYDAIEGKRYQHSIALVSHCASIKESLPILIEGYSKRFIRSPEGIDEVLRSRVSNDSEQLMYIIMLDHVVYDCWITQVIYHTTEEQFLKLYSFDSDQTNALLNRVRIADMKSALVKRNEFHLRHRELVKNIESTLNVYKARSLEHLLQPIFEKCKRTLLQFQEILGEAPFISVEDASPTYLELKISSYVLCILNLKDTVPLRVFVERHCQQLVKHSKLTLIKLQQSNLSTSSA